LTPAAFSEAKPGEWALSGSWTAIGLGRLAHDMKALAVPAGATVLDGSALEAVDSAGAWVLKRWLGSHHAAAQLRDWPARWQTLMELVMKQAAPSRRCRMPPCSKPWVSAQKGCGSRRWPCSASSARRR